MSDEVLIRVEGVSKKFCRTLKRSLMYGVQDLFKEMSGQSRGRMLRNKEFWALEDISFNVQRGEAIGLVGLNGAGKSTLLRLLSGLIKPDKGRIIVRGRVGALIQLGAGFNPVLTGRENVFLNASILGIPTKEIRKNFDAIVDFAGVDGFIDTPVRSYSSGMKVRLGFSVAMYLRPDILLVDEVLAVGDVSFRNKALAKMQGLTESGATVVFVSHNLAQVDRLCDRAIYLSDGKLAAVGPTSEILNRYVTSVHDDDSHIFHHPGTEEYLWIKNVAVLDNALARVDKFVSGEPLTIRIDLEVRAFLERPHFTLMIQSADLIQPLATLSQEETDDRPSLAPGLHQIDIRVPRMPLLAGSYMLFMAVNTPNDLGLYGRISNLAVVDIVSPPDQYCQYGPGVEIESEWRIKGGDDAAEPSPLRRAWT